MWPPCHKQKLLTQVWAKLHTKQVDNWRLAASSRAEPEEGCLNSDQSGLHKETVSHQPCSELIWGSCWLPYILPQGNSKAADQGDQFEGWA